MSFILFYSSLNRRPPSELPAERTTSYRIPFTWISLLDLPIDWLSLPILFNPTILKPQFVKICDTNWSDRQSNWIFRKGKMVLISVVRDYINRMLHDISGMKVLILDSQTVIFAFRMLFCFLYRWNFDLDSSVYVIFMLWFLIDRWASLSCDIWC